MSGENINKQEFHVRDLPTRSVTLYPASAHIVRDISDIVLKVMDIIVRILKSDADSKPSRVPIKLRSMG